MPQYNYSGGGRLGSRLCELPVNDEFLMTNDERMSNARSPKNLPLGDFLGTDVSSFRHSTFDIGEFFRHSDFDIRH